MFEFQRPQIRLVPEPTNEHDPNAIKVVARNSDSGPLIHVGYVPAQLAKQIVKSGMIEQIHPRLRMVQIGEYVDVEFDICGPRDSKQFFEKGRRA